MRMNVSTFAWQPSSGPRFDGPAGDGGRDAFKRPVRTSVSYAQALCEEATAVMYVHARFGGRQALVDAASAPGAVVAADPGATGRRGLPACCSR